MRRLNVLFSIILCTFLSFDYASANSIGDINNDGDITVSDGVLALRCSANLEIGFDCNLADVNGDSKITVTDGVQILRHVAGIKNTFRTSLIEPLPCGYYTDQITNDDLIQLDTHVTFIMEYFRNGSSICEQIRSLKLSIKPLVPIYHDHNASIEEIWQLTAGIAEDLESCIADKLVAGLYVGDHPDHHGVNPSSVAAAVDSANAFMPELPTMIYYRFDDYPRPANLTYQGIAFYDLRKQESADEIIERLLNAYERWGVKVIPILRAWDDNNECCDGAHGDYDDQQIASYIEKMFLVSEQFPWVSANMYYVFSAKGDHLGARDLPITRQTIQNLCTPSKQ